MTRILSTVGAAPTAQSISYPVRVDVAPALSNRNRLTVAFRPILAIPHMLLVGGPIALAITIRSRPESGTHLEWAGAGALGAVAAVIAMIAWFAIVFGSRYPDGLWTLATFYMKWRVRAVAYLTLLRDEYPPFGDGEYAVAATFPKPAEPRDRVSVAFRLFLALPHILVLWVLGVVWGFATVGAWFAILFTGDHPAVLYDFGVGVLRWSTRVEAYLLLLRDEYPPFSLH